jgi:hypothetical protein
MSSSISSLSQALQLMRVELAQARQRQAQPGVALPREAVGKTATLATAVSKHASAQLDALRARLRTARAQPGGLAPAKALRLFIEAALADEWGGDVQLDAGFHDLVERTCRALEADEEQAGLLLAAMQELDALS